MRKPFISVTPSGIQGAGADFALKGDNGKLYFFVHDLGSNGHSNVTVGGGGIGPRAFTGLKDSIRSVKWLDNGESLPFVQNQEADLFSFYASGYPYGMDFVVRVAEADIA